jgi:hypothetical protein
MNIQELIEKLTRNHLSKEDYPCLNGPSATFHSLSFSGTVPQNPQSMRSRRTPSWARPRGSDDGYSRYYFPYTSELISNLTIASDGISFFFHYTFSCNIQGRLALLILYLMGTQVIFC